MSRFQGKDDTADRIENVTRVLASGDATAKKRATEILAQWIDNHPGDVHVGRFRLRRAIYLKDLGLYEVAFVEAEGLVEIDPSSAPLRCFRGVILSRLKRYTDAIADFELAMKLDQTWSEPRLELVEKKFVLGNFDETLDDVQRFLALPDVGTREALVLKVLRVAASTLTEPRWLEGTEGMAGLYDVERVLIDVDQREGWSFESVWRGIRAVKQVVGTNADDLPALKDRLYAFLCTAEKKLITDKDVLSLGEKQPFPKR